MSDTDFPRPPAPAPQTAPENRLRRRLLQGVVAAAVAGTAAFFGWTRVLFPARPHRLLLGRVADFLPGAPPALLPDPFAAQYSVQCTGTGRFVVLSALCTHQGCSVDWDKATGSFLCPCHQGRYDASGRVIGGPPPLPLASLPHHIAGDKLFLNS